MTSEIKFPEGKYYGCNDPERLDHRDPWSAIEEYLDGFLNPKMSVEEVEKEISISLTVTAYNPMPISKSDIKNWSDSLVEMLGDRFLDEGLGDPDAEYPLCQWADNIMLKAVTEIIEASNIWGCEESGHITLTGEQVLALARKERPDWFEERNGNTKE